MFRKILHFGQFEMLTIYYIKNLGVISTKIDVVDVKYYFLKKMYVFRYMCLDIIILNNKLFLIYN